MLGNLIRRMKKLCTLNVRTWVEARERQRFHRGLTDPAAYWAGAPRKLFEESEPVFVLSTGRCGTELLTRVLRRIPGAECHHEPLVELLYSERQAYQEGQEKFEAYQTAIRTARFEMMLDAETRGRRYIETNYRITFFAPHLYDLFKRSRFVHLVRGPAGFVRSGVRLGYYSGLRTDIGRIVPVRGPDAARWPEMSAFERMAWLWNETNSFIERFKESADPARMLTVKAEDLFSDPAAAASIIGFCGLPVPPAHKIATWIKHKTNVKSSAVRVPPYKQWDDETKSSVKRQASLADTYGYTL